MITISDLALQYSGTFLFQHVDLQFTAGNCYGVIGANGAGMPFGSSSTDCTDAGRL